MEKYIRMAKDMKMTDALLISPENIYFDIRAVLKCLWGCEYATDSIKFSVKCNTRGTTIQERLAMVKAYRHILLVHANDATAVSKAVLEIERRAFLDGYYFASGIRYCKLCQVCSVDSGQPCPTPDKIRPCDSSSFGIDVYKTVRGLSLPCEVLQSEKDIPNRYGFVLID